MMIDTLGAVLRDFFTIVGVVTPLVLIGRALLMRNRRSITMAGRR